jgi:hypothetical protein
MVDPFFGHPAKPLFEPEAIGVLHQSGVFPASTDDETTPSKMVKSY